MPNGTLAHAGQAEFWIPAGQAAEVVEPGKNAWFYGKNAGKSTYLRARLNRFTPLIRQRFRLPTIRY